MLSWPCNKYPALLKLVLAFVIALSVSSHVCAQEVIKIGGVGSALGTMKLLADAFEKKHPGIRIEVLTALGSKGAIRAVPEGGVDIGLIGTTLTAEEARTGMIMIEYARTPFVFVTRKEIRQSGLTSREIVKIYRGEKQTWSGGERIRLVLHPAQDPDSLIVKGISPEVEQALDVALSKKGIPFALTDQENLDIIEKTPGALGYTTLTQVISENRQVQVLSLNGVAPGADTLADGSYPLHKTLSMLTLRVQSEKVRKFIRFVISEEGARILGRTGNLVSRPGWTG